MNPDNILLSKLPIMKKIISWMLRIVAAIIMAQSLYYKFTGHADSVAIFTALGMEPGGRILIGVLELVAAGLLLFPGTVAYGAIMSWGVMSGAILGHLTEIGIEGEMFELYLLAVGVWLCSTLLLVLHKDQIPVLRQMFEKADSAD
jgi:putative oxidoreductase